jgi:hypothetical protein
MRIETNPATAERKVRSRVWTFVLCSVAGLAATAPAAAKINAWNTGTNVDFYATVSIVREVPAGNPMPGLHLDAKVDGRLIDIYVAPMDFVMKYGVKLLKGDELHVLGIVDEDARKILAREITTGTYDEKKGVFRPDMTFYLRNEAGPLWNEAPLVASER